MAHTGSEEQRPAWCSADRTIGATDVGLAESDEPTQRPVAVAPSPTPFPPTRQAARLLLELSGRARRFYAAHLAVVLEPAFDVDGHQLPERRREVILDGESAAECIDTGHIDAAGFSSTEARLARLVAALTTGAPLDLASLTWMGSWSSQVWQVLCAWGTAGRLTASERS